MADRQIIWKCSGCGARHERQEGEYMGTTCPSCGKDGFLYIVHDENIGHKLKKRGNRHKKEDKRHQRSGKSLNPDHTTGCGHELATNE